MNWENYSQANILSETYHFQRENLIKFKVSFEKTGLRLSDSNSEISVFDVELIIWLTRIIKRIEKSTRRTFMPSWLLFILITKIHSKNGILDIHK